MLLAVPHAGYGQGTSLADVLRCVLSDHPPLRAAEARIRAARGGRETAGAFPNATLTFQTENGPFPGGSVAPGLSRETSIFGTLPIEALYQRWPRIREANADADHASAIAVALRRQATLDAARAFFRLALAQEGVRAAADVAARLDSLRTYVRARVAEGVAAEGELVRVELEMSRARLGAALQAVETARARGALRPYLAGCESGSPLDSLTTAAAENAVSRGDTLPPLGDLLARARERRPDLAAARARIAAGEARVALQRALFVRQLDLTFGTKRVEGVSTMIAGFSLPIPLLDQNAGGRHRADAERTAAIEDLRWTERIAIAEVEAAYESTLLLDRELRRFGPEVLARIQDSRRIALAAFEEGAAPLAYVLDASRAVAETTLEYYRALFEQRLSVLQLAVAVGDDPLELAPPPATPSSTEHPNR